MQIKRYTVRHLNGILDLFYDTVHTVNARDYSAHQVDQWAPRDPDREAWHKRLASSTTFVATFGNKLVGFGNLTRKGEIDLLYVHSKFQRRGFARAIIERIVAVAKRKRMRKIYAISSITALSFFQSSGFKVIRKRIRRHRHEQFEVYDMEKTLAA